MALLHIKSNNENLSYVVAHNPENPLICLSYKKGVMCGYYPNGNLNEYAIVFNDSIASEEKKYRVEELNDKGEMVQLSDKNGNPLYKTKYLKGNSFRPHVDSEYEYLTINEFADARFLIAAFDTFLKSAFKGLEHDVISDYEIKLFAIETNERVMKLLSKSFKGVEITYESYYNKVYNVTFKSNNTLQYLLKVLSIFSLFATLEGNDTYLYVTNDLSERYLKFLVDVAAPYFIRYVFKINMMRDKKFFESKKSLLNQNILGGYNFEWKYGDTHQSRIEFVKDKLFEKVETGKGYELVYKENCDFLDIGAGIDFRYLKAFGKAIEKSGFTYHAIERDEDAYEKIMAKIKRENSSHIKLYKSIDEFFEYYNDEELVVICSEVLEHNEVEEAKKLIDTVASELNYKKAIFTVPNKEFNHFYFDEEDKMRHNDHKWEYTNEEFREMCKDALKGVKKINIEFGNIGDLVLNEKPYSPTQYLLIN